MRLFFCVFRFSIHVCPYATVAFDFAHLREPMLGKPVSIANKFMRPTLTPEIIRNYYVSVPHQSQIFGTQNTGSRWKLSNFKPRHIVIISFLKLCLHDVLIQGITPRTFAMPRSAAVASFAVPDAPFPSSRSVRSMQNDQSFFPSIIHGPSSTQANIKESWSRTFAMPKTTSRGLQGFRALFEREQTDWHAVVYTVVQCCQSLCVHVCECICRFFK